MAGRQAKALSEGVLKRALRLAGKSDTPERDTVMVLLSARAGLRACETAGLRWEMVLDSRGQVATTLELADTISKYGSGRRLPMHPELRTALSSLRRLGAQGPVVRSLRGGALRPNSVVNWFRGLYVGIGAQGCSSHSGRRTFITDAARHAHRAGASLRDVQLLAGHRSIETTQAYIDGNTDAQRRLVCAL